MSRGRRYEEPKLNLKKVFAVIIAFVVLIMFIFVIKGILTKDKEQVKIVSKDYAVRPNKEATIFKLDANKIKEQGLKLYFANAKKIDENTYTSVSNSRLFAIATSGEDFEEIRKKVYDAIEENVDKILDYRNDIGKIYVH